MPLTRLGFNRLALCLGIVLVFPWKASATTINFAMPSDYSGTGAAPDPGTYWNPIVENGTTFTDKLSDGSTPTAVTLKQSDTGTYTDATSANGIALFHPFALAQNNSIQQLTMNNVPAGVYNLYLYGINGGYEDRGTTFTLAGGSTKSTLNQQDNTFAQGDNYVVFTNVSPTAGTIVVNWTANLSGRAGGTEGQFNGLQLMSVPEPSSVLLLGLGAIGLRFFGCRRRCHAP